MTLGSPTIDHVVWDWNGTLLDDLDIVIESVNLGVEWLGLPPVTVDVYRDHYTRPVQRFYARVAGRELTSEEWREIDDRFHRGYAELLDATRLWADATEALDLVRTSGATQSLLSMYPHDDLLPLVRRHGVSRYFGRIDGLRDGSGGMKADYLARHLTEAGLDATGVLVIGDTPDDARAAAHVGARAVLVATGTHHRHQLDEIGVPVAGGLVEALSLGGLVETEVSPRTP